MLKEDQIQGTGTKEAPFTTKGEQHFELFMWLVRKLGKDPNVTIIYARIDEKVFSLSKRLNLTRNLPLQVRMVEQPASWESTWKDLLELRKAKVRAVIMIFGNTERPYFNWEYK